MSGAEGEGCGTSGGAGGCPLCSPRRLAVLLTVMAAAWVALLFTGTASVPPPRRIEWPQFLEELKAGRIERVVADGREYAGKYRPGREPETFVTQGPELGSEPGLKELIQKNAALEVRE